MKSLLKKSWGLIGSMLITYALGTDWNPQRKLRPDAFEIGGYLHQAIGRSFDALQTDGISLVLVMATALWLVNRYLYHKPEKTGVGEYLLCSFFSMMQMLCSACRQTGTIGTLFENMFQLLKVALYLPGIWLLFLCVVRALHEVLMGTGKWQQKVVPIMNTYSSRRVFLFLCIAWLPHLIIKYPGALTIDTVLQFHQWMEWRPRTTPHPPFGSVVYGWLIEQALASGKMNLFYFSFTLMKTLAFIGILTYSLWVMKKRGVPDWVHAFALILFAVSPVYVGWTTVLSKDSSYLICVMLSASLMLEAMDSVRAFLDRKWKIVLLILSLSLMMLVRHNGILIALPLLAVLMIRLIRERISKKDIQRFACLVCSVLVLGVGTEKLIIAAMDIQDVSQDDWMALPLQQTARIVIEHEDTIRPEERAVLAEMFDYENVRDDYKPADSDGIRYSAHPPRTNENTKAFLSVWWNLVKREPVTALDAVLHMNGVLLDLQSNNPIYVGLTDHSLTEHVYLHSFNDMTYYNSEEIKPLNGLQRALTEWYYRFDDIPGIGMVARMSFCVETLICICYFSVIYRKRGMLCVLIPAIITAVSGFFCPIVYSRYLLPVMGTLPLWIAGWFASPEKHIKQEEPTHVS